MSDIKYNILLLFIKRFNEFLKFAYFNIRGANCMIRRKYDDAKKFFEKCLECDLPIRVTGMVYGDLGKCYFDTGELDRGKFYLLKALEIDDKQSKVNSEVSSRLGFIYFNEGHYEKAKTYFEDAIKSYKKIHYTAIADVKECLEKINQKSV